MNSKVDAQPAPPTEVMPLPRLPHPSRQFLIGAYGFYALLAIPLFLSAITLPFGYWDYFNLKEVFYPRGDWLSWSSFFPNLWHNLAHNDWNIRPTSTSLFHILFILFRGEFWTLWVLKWFLKLATACLVHKLVLSATKDKTAALCAFSLVFFNPVAFEIQPYSADPVAAFFIVAFLAYAQRNSGQALAVDLSALSTRRFWILFCLLVLTIGSKEAIFAFAYAYVFILVVRALREHTLWRAKTLARAAALLAPPTLMLLRLYSTGRPTPQHLSLGAWLHRIVGHTHLLIPFDGNTVWFYAFLLVCTFIIPWYWRRASPTNKHNAYLLALASLALLVMISIPTAYPPGAAPRYVIPVIPLAALLFGYALSGDGLLVTGVKWLFLILFPILTSFGIYSQHLSARQVFKEYSHVINHTLHELNAGHAVYVQPSGEPEAIISKFVDRYAEQLYGVPKPRRPLLSFPQDVLPPGPYVLVTQQPPGKLFQDPHSRVPLPSVRSVAVFDRTPAGPLQIFTNWFGGVNRLLRNTTAPRYDVGFGAVNDPPWWYIYDVGGVAGPNPFPAAGDAAQRPTAVVQYGPSMKELVWPESDSLAVDLDGSRVWALNLPFRGEGYMQVLLAGSVRVNQGGVIFGIADERHDLWNIALNQSAAPITIPSPPVVRCERGRQCRLFFYVPGGQRSQFVISGLRGPIKIPIQSWALYRDFGGFFR
jgi:hypothetical protein